MWRLQNAPRRHVPDTYYAYIKPTVKPILYNVQKNGGFGLEHAFRETDRGAANYHLLMQLAHNLWQLLVKGWVRREMAACRKLTDVCLAKLLAAALHLCGPPVEPLPAFQLRFADG